MQYRLLDASSILLAFDKEREKAKDFHLFDEIIGKEKFFYIPQFCITETFNTINKWYFRKANGKSRITIEQRNKIISLFNYMLEDRRYLYTYELNKFHQSNCNKIFPVEHTTPKENKAFLSAFDILVIAMGQELQFIHGKENFSIISSDKRLVAVSNAAGINAVLY